MEYARIEGLLEAILFAAGTPVETSLLSKAVGLDDETTRAILDKMRAKYQDQNRGIELLRLAESYQLTSSKAYAAEVKEVLDKRRDASLSAAALEVLAITAYNQPVTRAFLEQVRGVDSSGVVASLLEKGYLEEQGRLDVPGRPMKFGTTAMFLRSFGLSALEELPPIEGDYGLFNTDESGRIIIENEETEGSAEGDAKEETGKPEGVETVMEDDAKVQLSAELEIDAQADTDTELFDTKSEDSV